MEISLVHDEFFYNQLNYCILNKDYKEFQKTISQQIKINETFELIFDYFDNRNDSGDWQKCREFFYHLPDYQKGVQDFDKTNRIATIALYMLLNSTEDMINPIGDTVKIIDDLTIHQNRDLRDKNRIMIISKACTLFIQFKPNADNLLLSFISYSLDIISESAKEKLISKIFIDFCNLALNDQDINFQKHVYTLLNDFSYPNQKVCDERIDLIIEFIKTVHPNKEIKCDLLKDFFIHHERKKEILENKAISLSLTKSFLARSQISEKYNPP